MFWFIHTNFKRMYISVYTKQPTSSIQLLDEITSNIVGLCSIVNINQSVLNNSILDNICMRIFYQVIEII